jgi:hypothetical protein
VLVETAAAIAPAHQLEKRSALLPDRQRTFSRLAAILYQ